MTEKLYMENSYITESKGKVLLNKKVGDKYELILDKTIFYPEGAGGQKGDKGYINDIEVEKAVLKDGNIIHITNEKVPGAEVDIKIDWTNRHHIMIQHTTQHLVSQCFYRLFDIQTLSFHASDDFIYIDLDIENLEKERIRKVEELANEIIRNNFEVKTYYPSDEEMKKIDFRRDPKVENNLRVVEIDSFDFAACGGTHVKNTGELGLIKIVESKRQNGKTRIKVASGDSALKDYRIKNDIALYFMEELSGNEVNIYKKYNKFIESIENLKEDYKNLKYKTFKLIKEKSIHELETIEDVNVLIYDFSDFDFKEGNNFLKEFKDDDVVVSLYSKNEDMVNFIISTPESLNINLNDLADLLRKSYNLKGGGNKNMIQGIFFVEENENVEEIIRENLKGIIKSARN